MIVPAVDKIANAAMYLTPREQAKRRLEDLQIQSQTALLPQKIALEREQMNMQSRWLKSGNRGGMKYSPGHGWVPMSPLEIQRSQKLGRENAAAESDIQNHMTREQMANEFRKKNGYVPPEEPLPQPEDAEIEPAPLPQPSAYLPDLSRLRIGNDDEDNQYA